MNGTAAEADPSVHPCPRPLSPRPNASATASPTTAALFERSTVDAKADFDYQTRIFVEMLA
ncbi:MAG: hypothetical protein LBL59_07415 [Xanthomonadaceae bacterium]|jgi:hypothetical protein|nr:hypothetical protein [Xanthomonadaceae bacterium]